MHKKTDMTSKFTAIPDGTYPAVLEDFKLDLQNQYGPRLNLTFKLPNNRKVWVDLRENRQGTLNGAWFTCKKMGFATEMNDDLGEEFSTEQFLETASKYVEGVVGHYFNLELKTLETQKGPKQYGSVVSAADEGEYSNFNMKKAVQEANTPTVNADEEFPF